MSQPTDANKVAGANTDLERQKREWQHFEEVALLEGPLCWADRTEAGRRRQVLRGQRLCDAAALSESFGPMTTRFDAVIGK